MLRDDDLLPQEFGDYLQEQLGHLNPKDRHVLESVLRR
jgi:hypothetical protein